MCWKIHKKGKCVKISKIRLKEDIFTVWHSKARIFCRLWNILQNCAYVCLPLLKTLYVRWMWATINPSYKYNIVVKVTSNYCLCVNRFSKSVRHTDACLCKISITWTKLGSWTKTVKNDLFKPDFTDFIALFICFMAFAAHFYAKVW